MGNKRVKKVKRVLSQSGDRQVVLYVLAELGGKESVFIWQNLKPLRFSGPSVPNDLYQNIRAIFGVNGNLVAPKAKLGPEDKKHLRPAALYRPGQDTQERIKLLAGVKIRYLEQGWVEIRRTELGGEKAVYDVFQKLYNLPAAIRQQQHILDSLIGKGKTPGNISRLSGDRAKLGFIHHALLQWEKGGSRERKKLGQQIAMVIKNFGDPRNYYNVEISDRLTDIESLEDFGARKNPGAIAAQLVTVLDFIARRLNEIDSQAPKIALRKRLLVLEKARMDNAVNTCLLNLKNILHRDNQQLLRNPSNPIKRIEQIQYATRQLLPSPYYEIGHLCRNLLQLAIHDLKQGHDPKSFKLKLMLAHHALANDNVLLSQKKRLEFLLAQQNPSG